MKRLLDAQGDIISEFHYEDSGDTATVRSVQDAEPYIERNKRRQSAERSGYYNAKGDFMRHLAEIPNIVYCEWLKEAGPGFFALPTKEKMKFFRKKLNSSDWRWLKATDKQI